MRLWVSETVCANGLKSETIQRAGKTTTGDETNRESNEDQTQATSRTMCRNFPHMIIQALIEANEAIVSEFEQETLAVFAAVIGDTIFWAKDAMSAICCALDAMERFFVCRNANGVIASSKAKDKEVAERFDAFVKILGTTDPSCSAVPLRVCWQPKSAVYTFGRCAGLNSLGPRTTSSNGTFTFFWRLYSHLGNSDGVLGTFQVIRNHTVPEPMEQILALKVQGNYIDALPLCQKLMGQEVKEMVKCLLRSNQPLLARTFIEKRIEEEHDEAANVARIEDKKRLREYQLEAVCKLGDWDQLAELQRNLVGQNHADGVQIVEKWGAKIASIFCNLTQFDQQSLVEVMMINMFNEKVNHRYDLEGGLLLQAFTLLGAAPRGIGFLQKFF